ncbi:MAG: UbiD family decarboxylase [Desulfuromonadaceae bacterium]|nr:UbiD family decarboxylase [Geobacteraceae bacterium]
MSLRNFIQQHRDCSEVEDIHTTVDPDLQLSAYVYAQMCANSVPPVMLFHKPGRDSFCSVVANLFATRERLSRLLSHAEKTLSQRLTQLPDVVHNWSEACAWMSQNYPCTQRSGATADAPHIELDSLYALPQIRSWSGDSRAYFSLPTVFTRTCDSAHINAGVYRLAPLDSRTLTLNWRRGSRAYALWRSYADKGARMPVTVALGADPTLTFAALFPLPEVGAELSFWSFIRGGAQELAFNSAGLPVPSESEVILEGYVEPHLIQEEGRFANHTGYYTESVACPLMHVSSIRARYAAIMPITVVGPPPTENALVGAAVWDLLFTLIRRELPELLRLICPPETAYLPVVILQVRAPSDAAGWDERRYAIEHNTMLKRAHTLILVDETTAISTPNLIYWHCMNLAHHDYAVMPDGMRVVDGVRWRYSGKRKVSVAHHTSAQQGICCI